MRYYNYLIENKESEIIDLIKKKCQPFLKEWNGHNFLFRGMKHSFTYDIKQVQIDRKPKDIPLEIHEIIDHEFNKKFGWFARSNSVFCTGNQVNTEEYGNGYIIFPCGKYKYLSSNEIEDLFVYLLRFDTTKKQLYRKHFDEITYKNDILGLYKKYKNDKIFIDKLELFSKDLVKTYTNKDLNRLIMMGNEIMIQCKEYIAIRYIDIDIIKFKNGLNYEIL